MAKHNSPSLYVVVHSNKNSRVSGRVQIATTLDDARSNLPTEQQAASETTSVPDNSSLDFSKLHSDIRNSIRLHSNQDILISILTLLRTRLQHSIHIAPTLKECCEELETHDDRAIYKLKPGQYHRILSALKDATAGHQAMIDLPRLLLVGLISEFDDFLRTLLRAGINARPELVNGINDSITLKELRAAGSIDEAVSVLVNRKIDTILRSDHREQLNKIGELLNIKIDTNDSCVLQFLEACERRNLLVHNECVVNAIYLSKCRSYGIKDKLPALGEKLSITRDYFRNSAAVTEELAIKLCQFAWRKLVPSETLLADQALNQCAFELLQSNNCQLAKRLLEYGLSHKGKSTEEVRRMMIVNYANAIKLTGDKSAAVAELEKHDWSASNLHFQVSVAGVKDDVKAIADFIPSIAASNQMTFDDFVSWPVFSGVQSDDVFQSALRQSFPTADLTASPSTSGKQPTGTDGGYSRSSAKMKPKQRKAKKA